MHHLTVVWGDPREATAGFVQALRYPVVPGDRCHSETAVLQMLATYGGRILNVHPSLLPKYGGQGMYGLGVQEAVLAGGEADQNTNETGPATCLKLIMGLLVNPDDSDPPPAQKHISAGHQQDESQTLGEVLRHRRVCTIFNAGNQGFSNFQNHPGLTRCFE